MTDDSTEKNPELDWQAIALTIDDTSHGERIDKVLATHLPDISRSRIQTAIRQGDIVLNDHAVNNKHKVQYGDHITGGIRIETVTHYAPEPIALDVVFEDDTILVINKPAGFVVHPGAGNPNGTLLNALLHHVPHADTLPRAGIVHRLDKDTSGLLVVAKTHDAQLSLIQQLHDRSVSRTYCALAYGEFISGGTIDLPIGRDPRDRLKMKVTDGGKEAITHYQIAERFSGLTLLDVNLETGRTHQIRVHMTHSKHSLVGDKTYGRPRPPKGISDGLRQALLDFPRQCLHAKALSFIHPKIDTQVTYSADLPDDFADLLEDIRDETFVEDDMPAFWDDPAYGEAGEVIDED